MKLIYVTGNSDKFTHAKDQSARFGIELEQKDLDITEIQSNSISNIAEDKAKKAFDIIHQPLIVSDSGWAIPALNNFPGPYMKYINQWFNAEDFLALMQDKSDRKIVLTHVVALANSQGIKLIEQKIEGYILTKPEGSGLSINQLVVIDGQTHSIAKNNENNIQSFDDSEVWSKVADRLKKI